MNRDSLEVEEAYGESLSEPLEKAEKIGQADIAEQFLRSKRLERLPTGPPLAVAG
jgi:hypothetical protein